MKVNQGDKVEITKGEHKGFKGYVKDIDNNNITIIRPWDEISKGLTPALCTCYVK